MAYFKNKAVSKRKWLLFLAMFTLVFIQISVLWRGVMAQVGSNRRAEPQVAEVAPDQLPPGIIRHVGFTGAVHIPNRDVTVQFEGNTCVRITSTYASAHCCIGHIT